MLRTVELSKQAERDLKKVPEFIASKLKYWIALVEMEGLESARIIKGFHDEPLQGKRKGQRSIRLNRSYRAVYVIRRSGAIELVLIEEVSKHEY